MKQHQLRRSVVAHAKRMPDVRVDLVEAAFDCGEETENAATYKLSDALSDPIGAINLAREAVLKHIPTDDVEYGEAVHAFDEGITVASRMIQMRETYLWMNADTVPEAMALTTRAAWVKTQRTHLATADLRRDVAFSLKSHEWRRTCIRLSCARSIAVALLAITRTLEEETFERVTVTPLTPVWRLACVDTSDEKSYPRRDRPRRWKY